MLPSRVTAAFGLLCLSAALLGSCSLNFDRFHRASRDASTPDNGGGAAKGGTGEAGSVGSAGTGGSAGAGGAAGLDASVDADVHRDAAPVAADGGVPCRTDTGCDTLTSCTNTPGTRTCGACPNGYTGTGATGCTDINECLTSNGGCDALTLCSNTAGGRTCGACPGGYSGSGAVGCTVVAPSSLVYALNPATYTTGKAVVPNVPVGQGGPVQTYSVLPPLPTGLTLNGSTGAITGTPTAVAASATYVVTGANPGGRATVSLVIAVKDLVCPQGPGPTMVAVQGFCIDSTEVTNAQYAAFLAASPTLSTLPPECISWKTSYVPAGSWPATGQDTYPVASVDWCDAHAYCHWAGKHLCGSIGGGPLPRTSADIGGEWYTACSSAGQLIYPYGNTYLGTNCNGQQYQATPAALPVAAATGCVGGYPGLYDLSGNVDEWEDSCDAATGFSDNCTLRGGSFLDSPGVSVMQCAGRPTNPRNNRYEGIGFRCCAF